MSGPSDIKADELNDAALQVGMVVLMGKKTEGLDEAWGAFVLGEHKLGDQYFLGRQGLCWPYCTSLSMGAISQRRQTGLSLLHASLAGNVTPIFCSH